MSNLVTINEIQTVYGESISVQPPHLLGLHGKLKMDAEKYSVILKIKIKKVK